MNSDYLSIIELKDLATLVPISPIQPSWDWELCFLTLTTVFINFDRLISSPGIVVLTGKNQKVTGKIKK